MDPGLARREGGYIPGPYRDLTVVYIDYMLCIHALNSVGVTQVLGPWILPQDLPLQLLHSITAHHSSIMILLYVLQPLLCCATMQENTSYLVHSCLQSNQEDSHMCRPEPSTLLHCCSCTPSDTPHPTSPRGKLKTQL